MKRRSIAPVVACVALLASAMGGARQPRWIVQAPAELEPYAARLESVSPDSWAPLLALTGVEDFGPPIVVVLAAEGSPEARRAAPWISGYADGERRYIVLLPERMSSYPHGGLEALLRHELMHVLIAQAAGGAEVPRWFDEGLAIAAARRADLGDRARLALAVLSDSSLPIARLAEAFRGGETSAHSAYALAGDLVRSLLDRHGGAAPAAILARLAAGESFAGAFRAVTGESLAHFERLYWDRRTLWDRWIPIASSSVVLWAGIALLALAAFRRRRARDLELARVWREEEAREEERAARQELSPP